MDIEEHLTQLFQQSIEAQQLAAEALPNAIGLAGMKITQCLVNDGKILLCGNAGSAALAQRFAAHLTGNSAIPRPPLPAIALSTDGSTLTSIARDSSYAEVFSRQVQGLGREGDLLILATTTGNTENIILAVNAAHERDISVIALTGADGGQLADTLAPDDIEIRAPSNQPEHIQQIHLLTAHALCSLVDHQLFGDI